MTDSEILQALREARAEVFRLAKCVTNETSERAGRGELWQSDMCAEWSAYLVAAERYNALADKYLT